MRTPSLSFGAFICGKLSKPNIDKTVLEIKGFNLSRLRADILQLNRRVQTVGELCAAIVEENEDEDYLDGEDHCHHLGWKEENGKDDESSVLHGDDTEYGYEFAGLCRAVGALFDQADGAKKGMISLTHILAIISRDHRQSKPYPGDSLYSSNQRYNRKNRSPT